VISPDNDVVERDIHIAALPETVFSFFTDPAKMVRWLGIRATLNAQPGGICRININERDVVGGTYLEVVPLLRSISSLIRLSQGPVIRTSETRCLGTKRNAG